jgi:hypothetical protein
MAAAKTILVRHTHTGEIKEVTTEQRENQDKNYWVRITGDVKPTAPTAPEPKTTPKATPPKE